MGSKINFEKVKNFIEEKGWKLLSDSYTNLTTDLELQCPEGHTNYVCFDKFRRSTYECPICRIKPFNQSSANKPRKKKDQRVLALDQASKLSGWCVFEKDELIAYGVHEEKSNNETERIANTRYWLASMINKWQPDCVILEDIQLQKFSEIAVAVTTYKVLAHLQGVLENCCFENNIPCRIVSPATWRNLSEVKGKDRNERKKNAQKIVNEIYQIDVTSDEADAILIGRWGAIQQKKSEVINF